MAVQTKFTTLRLDNKTQSILDDLVKEFGYNRSRMIRHSIRLLSQINDIKKQSGEIFIRTKEGDKSLILLI